MSIEKIYAFVKSLFQPFHHNDSLQCRFCGHGQPSVGEGVLAAPEEALNRDVDTGDSEDVTSNVREYRKLTCVGDQCD